MLGRRHTFKEAADQEFPFVAAIAHLRTVADRTGPFDITQLDQSQGIAKDVLANFLDGPSLSCLKPGEE